MSGQICTGCGLKARGRWPDRHPWPAAVLAALASIVDLTERHPTAAMALVVPGALIGFAAVAAYPLVFVPLVVLFGVALVVSVGNEGTERNPICGRADCPAISCKP
jgi:hypothetical protein